MSKRSVRSMTSPLQYQDTANRSAADLEPTSDFGFANAGAMPPSSAEQAGALIGGLAGGGKGVIIGGAVGGGGGYLYKHLRHNYHHDHQ